MEKQLDNKVTLVTGASAGIGKATAQLFAKEGAVVYAVDINSLEWISEEKKEGETIVPVQLDICDFIAVKNAVMAIKKEYGRIDVLANIAGLISYELMPMIDSSDVIGFKNHVKTAKRLHYQYGQHGGTKGLKRAIVIRSDQRCCDCSYKVSSKRIGRE